MSDDGALLFGAYRPFPFGETRVRERERAACGLVYFVFRHFCALARCVRFGFLVSWVIDRTEVSADCELRTHTHTPKGKFSLKLGI